MTILLITEWNQQKRIIVLYWLEGALLLLIEKNSAMYIQNNEQPAFTVTSIKCNNKKTLPKSEEYWIAGKGNTDWPVVEKFSVGL